MIALVGSYTRDGGAGIHRVRLDPGTGALRDDGVAATLPDPSYLALHPDGRFLYAVSELDQGAVHAFALDRERGELRPLGSRPSGGGAPCHLSVHPSGRLLLVANYATGTAAALPIRADGSLGPAAALIRHAGAGPDPERQEGPHAHCALPSPDGRFAFVVDLGIDRVSGHLVDVEEPALQGARGAGLHAEPGSGPRHLAFAADASAAMLIGELASTLTALRYDPPSGVFTPVAKVDLLPAGFSGRNKAAAVRFGPRGDLVYASNRGHDSIAAVGWDGSAFGPVRHHPSGGEGPRDFALDPTGGWMVVANEGSGTLATLAVDPETGVLRETGERLAVPAPVCVSFI